MEEGTLVTCKENEGHPGEAWKRPPEAAATWEAGVAELGSDCQPCSKVTCFGVKFCASTQSESERWRKGQVIGHRQNGRL